MSHRIKKILIITAVILVIVFVILVIYNLFFKKRPVTPPPSPGEIPEISELVPETKERLIALTEESVLGAGLNPDGKINYVAWDGAINQIDQDGQSKTKLGTVASEKISRVEFSDDGKKISLRQTLPSGQNRYLIFDLENKTIKALPQNMEASAFEPRGSKIAMALLDKGLRQLVVVDDQAKTTTIASIKIPDLMLVWPTSNTIALTTRPSGLAYGLLYLVDIKTKKINRIIGNTYGLTALFSPVGDKVLVSKTDENGLNLEIKVLDLIKKTEKRMDLFSLPEKCLWVQDNRSLFCSRFETDNEFMMPDDYYKGKLRPGAETIVKINIETGEQKDIIKIPTDATDLLLSANEAYLFFINKIDGRLYRLTL
ncbi:MAG: hypothetical protein AAB911_02495 [Patescibacteria group bacterium]